MYTKFSHPSKTNHRVCQWVGAKSGSLAPAKANELKKKKPKMTKMLARIHHQSFLYIKALTFCLRSARSFMVRLSELSVQM